MIISVSRRPLASGSVAANVLEYGTGALNIDAARIQHANSEDLATSLAKNPGRDDTVTSGVYGAGRPQQCVNTEGRWPSNLILRHLPGCVSSIVTGAQPQWECVSGCPIPEMDVGGAGRYFKQIRGMKMETTEVPKDLLDYLYTLITPTHVGGETLIALDLNTVDWAAIPDGKYHGLIARGEPTEEQTEHLWRVVKPGAHVLLIAPESCPTGHRGTCSLEDRGFEIRDAILWAQEAEKLHYVPKANVKEREAGCEKLAALRKGAPVYEVRESFLEDEEALNELQEALLEAGVASEIVESMVEMGISKDKIPKKFLHDFKPREGSDKRGNSHPTVKPKMIMQHLLSDISKGAVVLDPFMGSGSTALACWETQHSFIGIEREPDYIAIADARVRHCFTQVGDAPELISEAPSLENKPIEVHGGVFDLFKE